MFKPPSARHLSWWIEYMLSWSLNLSALCVGDDRSENSRTLMLKFLCIQVYYLFPGEYIITNCWRGIISYSEIHCIVILFTCHKPHWYSVVLGSILQHLTRIFAATPLSSLEYGMIQTNKNELLHSNKLLYPCNGVMNSRGF